MSTPRALVLRTAGINCDGETVRALERAGARAELVHLKRLLAEPARLDSYGLMVIPGGFSYGDDIAAGRVLGLELRCSLAREIAAFIERGGFVLGICNGFQVLVEAGLFESTASQGPSNAPVEIAVKPAGDLAINAAGDLAVKLAGNRAVKAAENRTVKPTGPLAVRSAGKNALSPAAKSAGMAAGANTPSARNVALYDNASNRFECRWVTIEAQDCASTWLAAGELMPVPIAHGEGRFVVRDEATLRRLKDNRQIAFRYVRSDGSPAEGHPDNPNGSVEAIAGICDPTGRVLGLMPHPERNITPWNHPHWTRLPPRPEGEGLGFYRRLVEAAAGAPV